MEKKRDQSDVKSVRFQPDDWAVVGEVARKLGVSRSEFLKRAARNEAARILAGAVTQDVSLAKASTHLGGR